MLKGGNKHVIACDEINAQQNNSLLPSRDKTDQQNYEQVPHN